MVNKHHLDLYEASSILLFFNCFILEELLTFLFFYYFLYKFYLRKQIYFGRATSLEDRITRND